MYYGLYHPSLVNHDILTDDTNSIVPIIPVHIENLLYRRFKHTKDRLSCKTVLIISNKVIKTTRVSLMMVKDEI